MSSLLSLNTPDMEYIDNILSFISYACYVSRRYPVISANTKAKCLYLLNLEYVKDDINVLFNLCKYAPDDIIEKWYPSRDCQRISVSLPNGFGSGIEVLRTRRFFLESIIVHKETWATIKDEHLKILEEDMTILFCIDPIPCRAAKYNLVIAAELMDLPFDLFIKKKLSRSIIQAWIHNRQKRGILFVDPAGPLGHKNSQEIEEILLTYLPQN